MSKDLKKKTLTRINFSNLWPRSLDMKHKTWRKHENQSLANQTLKDEIGRGNNYTKWSKIKKIIVKIVKVKIKKNKLKETTCF